MVGRLPFFLPDAVPLARDAPERSTGPGEIVFDPLDLLPRVPIAIPNAAANELTLSNHGLQLALADFAQLSQRLLFRQNRARGQRLRDQVLQRAHFLEKFP